MISGSVNEILAATGNKNKLLELQTVAKRYGLTVLSPKEVKEKYNLGEPPEVEENASDYRGNAFLKAEAFFKWSGLPSLGDDSGLEVRALDNMPGIYSARYAGAGATDKDKIAKVLSELNEKLKNNSTLNRDARFYCYLVLILGENEYLEEDGELQGYILDRPKGDLGFGYDPIVHIHELNKTLSEVDFAVTCEKGFRAKAAEKLFKRLIS
ncbi:MAG: non-canonical purine NTP pyrophosphatase [Proteobacteria bacterium]|nr:non-canonical purine NTP pyrophosphatase [Pseudomonadota bacterium]